jgi:hypothetical protein
VNPTASARRLRRNQTDEENGNHRFIPPKPEQVIKFVKNED